MFHREKREKVWSPTGDLNATIFYDTIKCATVLSVSVNNYDGKAEFNFQTQRTKCSRHTGKYLELKRIFSEDYSDYSCDLGHKIA